MRAGFRSPEWPKKKMEGTMAATSPHTTCRLSTYVLTSLPQIVSSSYLFVTARFDYCFSQIFGALFLAFCITPKGSLVKPGSLREILLN